MKTYTNEVQTLKNKLVVAIEDMNFKLAQAICERLDKLQNTIK
jgi:hypothetical protein